jgi:hypothetical protein
LEAIDRVKSMKKNLRRHIDGLRVTSPGRVSVGNKGQALVEFTLCFLLLLVIAWIPADFGLAFVSAQLAANAAREGARVGAATPPGTAGPPPAWTAANTTDIETETCERIRYAFMTDPGGAGTLCPTGARVIVTPPSGGGCNQLVTVTIRGDYNYFFYKLLRLMGSTAIPDNKTITGQSSMRWEYQC